ncbi:hypothetical protein BgiMline_000082, partial [Biomphalaria glabrata]
SSLSSLSLKSSFNRKLNLRRFRDSGFLTISRTTVHADELHLAIVHFEVQRSGQMT